MLRSALSKLRLVLGAAVAGGLLVVAFPAGAHALGAAAEQACTDFHHVQTYYRGSGFYRGPAWHYGRTVTVSYDGTSCVVAGEPPGHYDRQIAGTATVFRGTSTSGRVLGTHGFSSAEVWNGVEGDVDWPSAWWGCDGATVDYSWQIPGIYTFGIEGRKGQWRWWQSAPAMPLGASHSFGAC